MVEIMCFRLVNTQLTTLNKEDSYGETDGDNYTFHKNCKSLKDQNKEVLQLQGKGSETLHRLRKVYVT